MAPSVAQLNDIKEQESDIFEELGAHNFDDDDDDDEPAFRKNLRIAKLKAKQQLALSDDSPFAHLEDIAEPNQHQRQCKEEKAALLHKETSQIREQLDFVKQRLQEIKSGKYNTDSKNESSEIKPAPAPRKKNAEDARKRQPETRYRPLTGRADCPNCACDLRRRSICDLCFKMNSAPLSGHKTKPRDTATATTSNCYVDYTNDHDNRPIRPAKERTLARVEVSPAPTAGQASVDVVEDVVVPGKVYTISRSLNEKRTKLAQAIDELKSMMDQVRAKSNKLEEERKLVQLYKDQWKYGPSIGGPRSSSRENLGLNQANRNYESRLDANLARDSKSVTGFKHIEPSLKLRQYNKPPVAPRRSISRSTKHVTVKNPTAPMVSARSRSLESLKLVQKARVPPHEVINENFQNGKASSEINLRKIIEDEEDEVEEKIEDQMEIADGENEPALPSEVQDPVRQEKNQTPSDSNEKIIKRAEEPQTIGGKVAQLTWIPVFGETEIKTVKKPAVRKVQVMKPSQTQRNVNQAMARSQTKPLDRYQSGRTSTKVVNNSAKKAAPTNLSQQSSDRVLNEASRKLRFASDLLEQEKSDSMSKNQLIVNKRSHLQPSTVRTNQGANSKDSRDNQTAPKMIQIETELSARVNSELTENSRNELARIEEMVNEQQKLLNRLAHLQERQTQVVSPITVTCSSPCCLAHRHDSSSSSSNNQRIPRGVRLPAGRTLLVSTLRDRLNKGKLQLARTLEQEREKYQQLKLRVDSSLRKQSDLQQENELLKQSLSKCIDTCLRDISRTFESLSETLADSMTGADGEQTTGTNQLEVYAVDEDLTSESSQVGALSHAAQFISDSKYLKHLKAHIEAIEQQRKSIFEELKKEKQKSLQLEMKLKGSQSDLDLTDEIKQKSEAQPKLVGTRDQSGAEEPVAGCSKDIQPIEKNASKEKQLSCEAKQVDKLISNGQVGTESQDQQSCSELDDSQSSVELYRKYIESMSPDIESIRRERKMILNEFDSIKKMLSVMDQ